MPTSVLTWSSSTRRAERAGLSWRRRRGRLRRTAEPAIEAGIVGGSTGAVCWGARSTACVSRGVSGTRWTGGGRVVWCFGVEGHARQSVKDWARNRAKDAEVVEADGLVRSMDRVGERAEQRRAQHSATTISKQRKFNAKQRDQQVTASPSPKSGHLGMPYPRRVTFRRNYLRGRDPPRPSVVW